MTKVIQLKTKVPIHVLKKTLRVTKDEGQKTRIKIILHTQKGLKRKDVAERLGVNIDTVTDVVKRYNDKGLMGIETHKGGRPEGNPKWDLQIFKDLKKEINKQKEYWSIPKMSVWIKENKQKDIPEITIWYHMTHSCNMSYKSARPHPLLGDTIKQNDFKKRGL